MLLGDGVQLSPTYFIKYLLLRERGSLDDQEVNFSSWSVLLPRNLGGWGVIKSTSAASSRKEDIVSSGHNLRLKVECGSDLVWLACQDCWPQWCFFGLPGNVIRLYSHHHGDMIQRPTLSSRAVVTPQPPPYLRALIRLGIRD